MAPVSKNSFGTRETLPVDGKSYEIFQLSALEKKGVGHVARLPFSLLVLLENLLLLLGQGRPQFLVVTCRSGAGPPTSAGQLKSFTC